MNNCERVRRKLDKKSRKVTKLKLRIKDLKAIQKSFAEFKRQIANKEALRAVESSYAKKESNRQQQQQITNVARKVKEAYRSITNQGVEQQQQQQKKINSELQGVKNKQIQAEASLQQKLTIESLKRNHEGQIGRFKYNIAREGRVPKPVEKQLSTKHFFTKSNLTNRLLRNYKNNLSRESMRALYKNIPNTLICSLINLGMVSGQHVFKNNSINISNIKLNTISNKFKNKVKLNIKNKTNININQQGKYLIKLDNNDYIGLDYPNLYDSKYGETLVINEKNFSFDMFIKNHVNKSYKIYMVTNSINS